MKKFTTKQIENWRAYEKVRLRGRFNMFDPRARAATGLERDDYVFVIENFIALEQQANAGEIAT